MTSIAVWFSCGAASAVAAWVTCQRYPDANIRILNNPVIEEHPDNLRFAADVEKRLGRKIEYVLSARYLDQSAVSVWAHRNYVSGRTGAPCTVELKKKARQEWEKTNHVDWHVLGFTLDEKKRHDRFVLTERSNVLPVLIDAGLTKEDCIVIIKQAWIKLPAMYSLDFPNANCIGCVKATSPTYWNLVRKRFHDVFAARADQSRQLGARLVRYKGERIFLDELPPDANGRPMKNMDIECGIFCEEWPPRKETEA